VCAWGPGGLPCSCSTPSLLVSAVRVPGDEGAGLVHYTAMGAHRVWVGAGLLAPAARCVAAFHVCAAGAAKAGAGSELLKRLKETQVRFSNWQPPPRYCW
jgi:hypothetical protein